MNYKGFFLILFLLCIVGIPSQAASLHEDMLSGDVVRVKAALAQGVDVNIRNDYGYTPLHAASDTGNLAVTQVLIAHGADINAVANDGTTPLHTINVGGYFQATERFKGIIHPDMITVQAAPGHLAVAKLLLKHGARIDQQDNLGLTPLHTMVERGMVQVAELLINNGANPWLATKQYLVSPLHRMADMGYDGLIGLSLEKWPAQSVDVRDCFDNTPLMYVGSSSYRDAQQGAAMGALGGALAVLDPAGKQASSPQPQAPSAKIEENHLRAARLLLQQGANVNAQASGEDNKTPLHNAAESGAKPLVQELLNHGADRAARTSTGQTPLDMAKANNHSDLFALLASPNQAAAAPQPVNRPVKQAAKAAAGPAPQHAWDLLGKPVYDYAVEDFLRRKGQTQFWVYRDAKAEPRKLMDMLALREKSIAGTSIRVSVNADLKIDAIRFVASAGEMLRGPSGLLPYHGLRVDMSRSEIEKALGPPDKLKTGSEHVIPDWPDATRAAKFHKTTTLIYLQKGIEVKFEEQDGWLASDKISYIKVKDRELVVNSAPTKNKHTGKGMEEIKKDLLAAQDVLVAGNYGQAEAQFSQTIQALRNYVKYFSPNNYPNNYGASLGAALYFRGLSRIMLGRYEEANEDLRSAVFGCANNIDDYLLLGITEILTGRMDRAWQRVADLRAAKRSEQAAKLERNISLHQQGKAMDL